MQTLKGKVAWSPNAMTSVEIPKAVAWNCSAKKNYWKLIKIQALVSKKTAVGMQFHQKETKKET